MAHLLALVLLIGFVDSANPTTIAPALYLAAGKEAHRGLAGFIIGGFAVNFAAGLLLALGPGQAALALIPRPGDEARHILELAGGGVTLALAVALWLGREHVARHVIGKEDRIDRSSILVGAGLMFVELPTAIPYFAVIAAVVGSGRPFAAQAGLIAIFNAAFFFPLFVILVVRALANERGRRMIERLRSTVDRKLATLVPMLVLLVSLVLLAIGGIGVLTD